MNNITYKNKRGTEKEYPHTNVYLEDKYIGYYIKDIKRVEPVGVNYTFCPKMHDILDSYLYGRTKTDLKSQINDLVETICKQS